MGLWSMRMSTLVIWWGPLHPKECMTQNNNWWREKEKRRRDNGWCNQSVVSALSHSREEPLIIIFPFKNLRNTSTTKPLSSPVSSIFSFHSPLFLTNSTLFYVHNRIKILKQRTIFQHYHICPCVIGLWWCHCVIWTNHIMTRTMIFKYFKKKYCLFIVILSNITLKSNTC